MADFFYLQKVITTKIIFLAYNITRNCKIYYIGLELLYLEINK